MIQKIYDERQVSKVLLKYNRIFGNDDWHCNNLAPIYNKQRNQRYETFCCNSTEEIFKL